MKYRRKILGGNRSTRSKTTRKSSGLMTRKPKSPIIIRTAAGSVSWSFLTIWYCSNLLWCRHDLPNTFNRLLLPVFWFASGEEQSRMTDLHQKLSGEQGPEQELTCPPIRTSSATRSSLRTIHLLLPVFFLRPASRPGDCECDGWLLWEL